MHDFPMVIYLQAVILLARADLMFGMREDILRVWLGSPFQISVPRLLAACLRECSVVDCSAV